MYKSKLTHAFILCLCIVFSSYLSAQTLAAGNNNLVEILGNSKILKNKIIKNNFETVPSCDTVSFFKVSSTTGSKINLKWQHLGDPSKVKYLISWKRNGIPVGSDIVNGACGACFGYAQSPTNYTLTYSITNLISQTAYTVTINAMCDISPNGSPDFVDGPTTTINTATNFPDCNPPGSIIVSPTITSTSVSFQPNSPDQRFYIKTTNVQTGASKQKLVIGLGLNIVSTSIDTLLPCTAYHLEIIAQCFNPRLGIWINSDPSVPIQNFQTDCCGNLNNLTISASTPTTLVANWSSSVPAEKYQITTQTLAGLIVKDTIINAFNSNPSQICIIRGLSAVTQYLVKVTPLCGCNSGTCIATGLPLSSVGLTTNPCATPSSISTLAVSSNSFTVEWYQLASTKYRKYEVSLYNDHNVLIETKIINNAILSATTMTTTFNGLEEDTQYSFKLKTFCCNGACCEATPLSTTCTDWTLTGIPTTLNVKTIPTSCNGAINTTISNLGATVFRVSWQNPDLTKRRYRIQLLNGINIEKDQIVNGEDSTRVIYSDLTPNTTYNIKIESQCCIAPVACVWKIGEIITKTTKTLIATHPLCDSTATFTFKPRTNKAAFYWVVGGTQALDVSGRRFIIEGNFPNSPKVIYSPSDTLIEGLAPNTTYTFSVKQVFDGNMLQYNQACAIKGPFSVKTLGANNCDMSVNVAVKCSDKDKIYFTVTKTGTQTSNLSFYYREITPTLKLANNTFKPNCQNTDTGLPINYALDTLYTVPQFQERNFDAVSTIVLEGLKPCAYYEVYINSTYVDGNGNTAFCKAITIPNYQATKSETTVLVDVDQDGIPDICDDNIATPPVVTNQLPDVKCNEPITTSALNKDPLALPSIGQVWSINYIPIEITTLVNASGVMSGEGVVALPFQNQKMLVTFSGVKVNKDYRIFEGSVVGKKDANKTQISTLIDQINISNQKIDEKFCDKPEEEGMKNGVNSATGAKYDANGFDANGNYVKPPIYVGYVPGAPIDPKYTPTGFDKDGKAHNGSLFNNCGCDVKGLDKDGKTCDNAKCGPYYWVKSQAETAEGLALYENVKTNLKGYVIKILNTNKKIQTDTMLVLEPKAVTQRNEMKALATALKYENQLVFGPNDAWINPGMSKLFDRVPLPFGVNMTRKDQQLQLEGKHISLFFKDVTIEKSKVIIKTANNFLQTTELDNLIKVQETAIKALPADVVKKFRDQMVATPKDTTLFKEWLANRIKVVIDYYVSVDGKTVNVDDLKINNHTILPQGIKSEPAGTYYTALVSDENNANQYINALNAQPERMAEMRERQLQFEFDQGLSEIGGMSRAFVLQEIERQRKFKQLFATTAVGGAAAFGQPLIVSKTIAGKTQSVYFDNLRMTPVGAQLDIYVIVNTSKKQMVFSAKDITFNKAGFQNATIGLASDISFPISNVARFTLKGNNATNVTVSCDGFEGMSIGIDIELCRKYFTPLDPVTKQELPLPALVKASVTTGNIQSFNEIVINDLSFTPFEITEHRGPKFTFEHAVLDFSDIVTPATVKFPSNYFTAFNQTSAAGAATPSALWKGFYCQNLTVTIPEKMTKKPKPTGTAGTGTTPTTNKEDSYSIEAHNFIIDDGGFTGKAAFVGNILDISKGSLGGWAFSIDGFEIGFIRNKPTEGGFNGKIHVPIAKKDVKNLVAYHAKILPGDNYSFSLDPITDLEVDIWKAKAVFHNNSNITITSQNDDFVVKAKLTGDLAIADNSNNPMDFKLAFEDLGLTNQAPYVTNVGKWSTPRIGAKMKGFEIELDKINLHKGAKEGDLSLDFSLKVLLGQESSVHLGAQGSFSFLGKIDVSSGTQQYVYDRVQVHEIGLKGKVPGASFSGKLGFFDDEDNSPTSKIYGTGFFGGIIVDVDGLAKFNAVGTFGKIRPAGGTPYKYFLVDVLAQFPGVPIMAGVNLTGAGGGVYWHMTKTSNTLGTSLPLVYTASLLGLKAGETLTKDIYEPTPDPILGIRLLANIESSGNSSTFNANTLFEISFDAVTYGIKKVEFKGIAKFMQEAQKDGSQETKPAIGVVASIQMLYEVQKKVFQANMAVSINVGNGAVIGCEGGDCAKAEGSVGHGEIYISPEKWYINMGRTDPARKRFLSVGIGLPNSNNTSASNTGRMIVNAYFSIGSDIPPIPPLPDYVLSLVGKEFFPPDESIRSNGRGFAFGASLALSVDETIKPIYANINVGAGFDLMLMDYGSTTTCSNNNNQIIGINGWYATGQAYAYVSGAIGVIVKDKKLPIINAGAVVVLQAQGPNPFWAQGVVAVKASILGGLYTFNENFNMEIGEKCQKQTTGGTTVNANPLIISIAPDDKTHNVSLRSEPTIQFAFPVDKPFRFDDGTKPYNATLKIKEIALKGKNGLIPFSYDLNLNRISVKLSISNMLPANDSLILTVVAGVYKDNSTTAARTETKSIYFITEAPLTKIAKDNIAASYPVDGMFNYYRKEVSDNSGYVQLHKSQAQLFTDIPEDYSPILVITEKDKLAAMTTFEYDNTKNRVKYTMPNEQLGSNKIYKLQLMFAPLGYVPSFGNGSGSKKGLASSGDPQIIYTAYFRTSQYETFLHKMKASTLTMTQNASNFETFINITGNNEPFDELELGNVSGKAPCILIKDFMEETAWYTNTVKEDIYNKYPGTIKNPFEDDISINTFSSTQAQIGIDRSFSKIVTSGADIAPTIAEKEFMEGSVLIPKNMSQSIVYKKYNYIYKDYVFVKDQIEDFLYQSKGFCPDIHENVYQKGTEEYKKAEEECANFYNSLQNLSKDFPSATVPSNVKFTFYYKPPVTINNTNGSTINSFDNWFYLSGAQPTTIFDANVTKQ
jgi:hypothetical protein